MSGSHVSPKPISCGKMVVGVADLDALAGPPSSSPCNPSTEFMERNPEPQNARAKMQRIYFFIQRHQRYDIADAFFRRKVWILKRILVGLGKTTLTQCKNKNCSKNLL